MVVVLAYEYSKELGKSLAKKLKAKFSIVEVKEFPDREKLIQVKINVKGKQVIVVNSLFNPDEKIIDICLTADTLKDLGAKNITLIAPYLGYMRQDKRFHPGECVSSRVMAKLLNNSVDKIITIDPHIHRYKSLKDIFTIPAKKLTANPLIADYIEKKFRNEVIIGPDWESYQWAEEIAKHIKVDATVLKKTRFSSRHVEVKMVKPVEIKGKNVIIVDDIISTGHTVIEAAKKAKGLGAKSVSAIGVHGLFAENALGKLKKAKVKVITCNTIEGNTAKIDVLPIIFNELKKEKR